MQTLAHYLQHPEALPRLSASEWDVLLRQAQATRLHGSLAQQALQVSEATMPQAYPPAIQRTLRSALIVAEANQRAVETELVELHKILAPLQIPLIALKGAAYVLHGFPFARGRFVTDVDILVPRAKLALCEDALKFAGYSSAGHSAYDQRYYRQWMHELPPLRHSKRGSSLDVHHHILPLTARAHPPIDALLAALVPARDGWQSLSPCDLVLHSLLHLFFDGEWDHALRDLYDIQQLLQQFGAEPAFYSQLLARADALELSMLPGWALPVLQHWFPGTVPDDILRAARDRLPRLRANAAMQQVFIAGSTPDHASCRRLPHRLARRLLYLRGHYLRMPLPLLLPHLLRKSLTREEDARREAQ